LECEDFRTTTSLTGYLVEESDYLWGHFDELYWNSSFRQKALLSPNFSLNNCRIAADLLSSGYSGPMGIQN